MMMLEDDSPSLFGAEHVDMRCTPLHMATAIVDSVSSPMDSFADVVERHLYGDHSSYT